MKSIIVDDKQAEIIRTAVEKVEVRDPGGKVINHITPVPTEGEIAEAKKRLEERRCRMSQ